MDLFLLVLIGVKNNFKGNLDLVVIKVYLEVNFGKVSMILVIIINNWVVV